jgi:hypothetical protein
MMRAKMEREPDFRLLAWWQRRSEREEAPPGGVFARHGREFEKPAGKEMVRRCKSA